MQKFLLATGVILSGLFLSIGYSVFFLGTDLFFASVGALAGRFISVFIPVETYAHQKDFARIIKSVVDPIVASDLTIGYNSSYASDEQKLPMIVPTNGIAGHKNFLYLPEIHPGIDIWTSMDGAGLDGSSKGYSVYAACSGKVFHYKPANEEIEIICDKLPEVYRDLVPSLNVKILYSHLGDGQTGESFHNLKVGQRVEKGELVGYQGNKSSFAPENRIVHLHFGVYDLSAKQSPPPPLDPMYYIGVDTHKVGQIFTTEQN